MAQTSCMSLHVQLKKIPEKFEQKHLKWLLVMMQMKRLTKMHFSDIMKKIYIYGLWRQRNPLPNTHWYSPLELEQALGDSGGQGTRAYFSPWGCRVGHDLVIKQRTTQPARKDRVVSYVTRGSVGCTPPETAAAWESVWWIRMALPPGLCLCSLRVHAFCFLYLGCSFQPERGPFNEGISCGMRRKLSALHLYYFFILYFLLFSPLFLI